MDEALIEQEEYSSSSSLLVKKLYVGHFLARWGARFFILDLFFILSFCNDV